MKEFNETPFKKDTPVVPFSNGTEFMSWQFANCEQCINYESVSTNEESAKCKLAFHLDFGTISGDIPLWVAKGIGCDYDPLYGTVKLVNSCLKKRNGNEPF
jgi:hypothetical protein